MPILDSTSDYYCFPENLLRCQPYLSHKIYQLTEFKIVLITYSLSSLSPGDISETLTILDRSLPSETGPTLLLGISNLR